jgi:hypothetical protein
MTLSKSTLVGLTLLGIASSGAHAQMTQQPGQQTQQPGQQTQQPAQPTPPVAPNSTPSQRLTPAPAHSPSAAPGAMGAKPSLKTLDKDHDGKVNMTEAAADPNLAKKFAQLDRNRDGKLDAGEFAKYTP